MDQQSVKTTVERWVHDVVVDLNLCPFARRELVNRRVRFAVTEAESTEALLVALHEELWRLNDNPDIETTLLIHPLVLAEFGDYNEFLAEADNLLRYLELEGIYQIASFHPDYQFGGTQPDDAENYTNRSPWPMLHLLREESLERAIDRYPDVDGIPQRNIELMQRLGAERMRSLLDDSFSPDPTNQR